MKKLLVLFLFAGLFSCGNTGSKELLTPNPDTGYPYQVSLLQEDGQVVPSSKVLKAQPTVVLFWLTTCGPCRREIKALSTQYQAWKAEMDFELVLISRDFEQNRPRIWELKNEGNWPFTSYIDKDRVFGEYMPGALNGLPQLFLFDAKGNVVYHSKRYLDGDELKLYDELKKIAG